jgi:divalent metal cation (Fe/Co/Zn/Cd) transporter
VILQEYVVVVRFITFVGGTFAAAVGLAHFNLTQPETVMAMIGVAILLLIISAFLAPMASRVRIAKNGELIDFPLSRSRHNI